MRWGWWPRHVTAARSGTAWAGSATSLLLMLPPSPAAGRISGPISARWGRRCRSRSSARGCVGDLRCRWASWPRAMSSPAASCISSRAASWIRVRSVDTLIWALIWINVVGLGPFAGALAIASHRFGGAGQADVGGDRDRRSAGRSRACCPAAAAGCGDPLRPAAAGAADLRRARRCISSNPTPARRPSSASSARAASGCICPR